MRHNLTLEAGSAELARFAEDTVADAGIDITCEGANSIDPDTPYVYMSNHQSHMDVPVIYATCPARHLRMVGKKELFRVPLWGRAMREGGMVCIDRSNNEQAVQSLKEAEKTFARGISIWIAPEGTRTSTGEIGRLKKGGFYLAKNAGVDILPMAISGTLYILPKGTVATARDLPVKIIYGAPITTKDKDIPTLMAEVDEFLKSHVEMS